MRTQIIIIIFFFLLVSFFSLSKAAPNHLPKGSSLSVENPSSDFLTSPNKTFTCGFYNLGANAYWFSIWFTHSKNRTVVWTANRDKPVNGRGSSLTFKSNGALILTDFDGSISWETNTSSTNVDRLELLESGNLVLKNPSGKILWQSFDSPTDTLLPNQPFTKNQILVSKISQQVFSSGYFQFLFDNYNVLRLIYDGPEITSIYWPNPDKSVFDNGRTTYNSSRVAIIDDVGTFVSSDQLQFSVSDVGFGIKRRLTLDYDGNLRVYSLNERAGSWVITWQAMGKSCEVHGFCGRNGICVYTPEPTCSCPPYYELVNSTDLTQGCRPKFSEKYYVSHRFVELPNTDYYGFDLNYTKSITFDDCQQLCLGDYRCRAFRYRKTGSGECFTKGTLFNGRRSTSSTYMRIPTRLRAKFEPQALNLSHLECGRAGGARVVVLPANYEHSTSSRFKWVYMYSFAIAIGTIEVIIAIVSWWFLFKKHSLSSSLEDGYRAISSQFRSFSYSELKKATCKFNSILGRGGFGAVYKGVLKDERVVAVKKLEGMVQGEEEFWVEVSTFGGIYHMNLVRMWGFCSEGKHRLLVYEYVENGSLDNHLFRSSINNALLGWEKRFKIAIGTAKGLAYLHHECLEWVIHCDVKPENILLDSDFEPKISDFGLSKLCQRGNNGSLELSRIRGTKGYMAPEWTTNLPLTSKVDVYSYGVVILELVSGTRLSNWVIDEHHGDHQEEEKEEMQELPTFVRSAKRKFENGEDSWIEALVDPRLEGNFNRNQAAKMIEVGLSCVENDRNKRPTMELVALVLTECEDVDSIFTPGQ